MRTTDLENLATAVVRGAGDARADDALELLEDEAAVTDAIEAGAAWALCALGTLSDGSVLWRSTLELVALRIDADTGPSAELAALYARAGDWARAARALVASFPTLPDERALWAALCARQLVAERADGASDLACGLRAAPKRDAVHICLSGCRAMDRELLRAVGIEPSEALESLERVGSADAIARLRTTRPSGDLVTRLAADGRWLATDTAAARADGLLEIVEPTSVPGTEVVTAMLAALGGRAPVACRRSVEPALDVVELWQPAATEPPLMARLLVVGSVLGIAESVLEAASLLAGDLEDLELGLLVDAGGELRREIGMRGRVATLGEAPWVLGVHRQLLGRGVAVRALVGASVSISLESAPVPLPPPPVPAPGRGAAVLLADCGEQIAGWTPELATRFRVAAFERDPEPLPGGSALERRIHARAVAARFAVSGDLGLPLRITDSLCELAERVGLARALALG